MTFETFRVAMESVFGAHCKPMSRAILTAIWERVQDLPDEFLPWASLELKDMEKLPSNLGFYIAKTLWPQWRTQHRSKTAQEYQTCPDCNGRHDLPGAGFYGFRRDEEGVLWLEFIPCRCFREPSEVKVFSMTKRQAEMQGYTLVPPSWKGTLLAFEKHLRGQTAICDASLHRDTVNRALQADSTQKDAWRFRNMSMAEQAEVL